MELENLSNEELLKIAGGEQPKPKTQGLDLEDLSDEELQAIAGGADPLEAPSFMEKAGKTAVEGIIKAGQFVDSYAAAPLRAAVGAYQEGKNPVSAFKGQTGENPINAPSGKEINLKAGVTDEPFAKFKGSQAIDIASRFLGPVGPLVRMAGSALPTSLQDKEFQPSPADVGGFAVDVGLDITNILPGVAAAKMAGKGLLATVKGVGKGASAIASPLLRATGDAALKAGKAVEPALSSTKLGSVAVDTAKSAKRAMDDFFSPKQAPDFKHYAELAERNGIDPSLLPESIEFGSGSSVSRIARNVRENPMIGEPDMERFRAGLMQVDSAIDNQIAKIGGGPPLSDIEAGQMLKKSYESQVDNLFGNEAEMTYSQVVRAFPGIELTGASRSRVASKLDGVEKWAKGRMSRGFTATDREQGAQVLRAIEAVKAGNGSLKQTYETMLDIGRVAYRQGKQGISDIPPDIEKFRDLYETLSQEFLASTRHHAGHGMADALQRTNQKISSFLKTKEPIANLLDNDKIAPEKLFRNIVVGGDSRKLSALKEMLTPEQFNRLRASYVERFISRDSDGVINFRGLRTALQKDTSTLSVLFAPDEIGELVELAKMGEKWGPAVLSTSGTGASNILRDALEGIKSGATNKATLDYMKQQARGGVLPADAPKVLLPPGPSQQRFGFSRPTRNNPEELAKLLQVVGAAGTSRQKEEQTAVQRKLEELIRKRMAQ